jgi:hypothetical protein
MLKTKINPSPVCDRLLTVYLLAVNRPTELRAGTRGMADEDGSLAAKGCVKKLQTKYGVLEPILYSGMERAS